MDKLNLRRVILGNRSTLDKGTLRSGSAAIRELLLDQPWVQMAGLVACYWSVGSEPSTQGLVLALWKHGATVILPVQRPDGLAGSGPERPAGAGGHPARRGRDPHRRVGPGARPRRRQVDGSTARP